LNCPISSLKKCFLWPLLACCSLLPALATAQTDEFNFVVAGAPLNPAAGESSLRDVIAGANQGHPAFIVVNGIKAAAETCSDKLYARRKSLLNDADSALIVSLTAADWSDCKNARGKSAALERLERLRELLFASAGSFGAQKIPLVRQSFSAKFRSYAENAHWKVGKILFATIHLPANNNRYLSAAGLDSEFQDRLIANRDWLQRIFILSKRHKLDGIVLFCDGDPLAVPSRAELGSRRDGFAEARRQIISLAGKFRGKVLLISGHAPAGKAAGDTIRWQGNLGSLHIGPGWAEVTVAPSSPLLFAVSDDASGMKTPQQSPPEAHPGRVREINRPL
jgi:hypothetical protein